MPDTLILFAGYPAILLNSLILSKKASRPSPHLKTGYLRWFVRLDVRSLTGSSRCDLQKNFTPQLHFRQKRHDNWVANV